MADSNLTALAYQAETSYGTPPATVALKKLRFTKETFDHDKMTVESQDIREDRQIEEVTEVGVEAKGGFEFELAVGEYDELLAAAFMSVFADVSSVPTMKNGVTKSSYVFEKKILTDAFANFKGMNVETLSLKIASRTQVTGSFGFIGKTGAITAATIDTAGGYTAASTGLKLSASSDIGTITADGVAIADLKSVDFNLTNNLRAQDSIGAKSPTGIGVGSVKISGKMEAYFRNRTLVEKFMNHGTTALVIEMSREASGAVTGDHLGYRITLPKLHFPKGMPMIGGKDQDVMLPIEYTAIASGPTGYTAMLEKLLKA